MFPVLSAYTGIRSRIYSGLAKEKASPAFVPFRKALAHCSYLEAASVGKYVIAVSVDENINDTICGALVSNPTKTIIASHNKLSLIKLFIDGSFMFVPAFQELQLRFQASINPKTSLFEKISYFHENPTPADNFWQEFGNMKPDN